MSRLRTVFLFIGLVIISELVIGSVLMRSLNKSVDDLTVSSISIFLKTEDAERGLKDLLLVLQRIDGVSDSADLPTIEADLAAQLTTLRSDARELLSKGNDENQDDDIRAALDIVEDRAGNLLDAKGDVLNHITLLETRTKDLNIIRESLRSTLEDLSFAAATDPPNRGNTNGVVSRDTPPTANLRTLSTSNTLTAVALELDSIIDRAIGIRNEQNAEELSATERELRFRFRGLIVLIGQVNDSPARIRLAQGIVNLRSIFFGQQGMIVQASGRISRHANMQNLLTQLATPITEISNRADLLRTSANARIATARADLELATRRVIAILLITTALSLLLIFAAMTILVDRQINRRMARLTKAVLEIAKGNTDYKVDVSGQDELGKIAAALNVFKVNAKELGRSNSELEQFAYVAAHDLRAPLRAIQDLTEWTMEDPENVFSEDSHANMALMKNRVDRLNQLLSDLLEYSRVGQESKDVHEVSIQEVVQDVAQMLDPEKRFEISSDQTFDTVYTYATPLHQILLNLVSNSIKHHDRVSGEIHVSARHTADRIILTITDDGPGIDPNYHSRVFDLFQTLRPRDDVEGSGLGLAIIRKLLEHYGGTIRVQSDPDHARGTTFILDLPEMSQEIDALQKAA